MSSFKLPGQGHSEHKASLPLSEYIIDMHIVIAYNKQTKHYYYYYYYYYKPNTDSSFMNADQETVSHKQKKVPKSA